MRFIKRLITPKLPKPKEWFEIDVPFQACSNDYVTYKTILPKQTLEHINLPCYSGSMVNLNKIEFVCSPNNKKKSILPDDIYLRWMQLCKDYGLCPTSSEAFIEKDKQHFRCRGKNRHRVYAALCCYRWADNVAPIPYTVVRLLDMNPRLTFYQVLHYALAKYITNSNHNFISIAGGGSYLAYPVRRLDLLSSVSIWLFFNHPDGRKACLYRKWKDGVTHARIASVPTEIGFGANETLPVKDANQLMWEEWARMYHFPDPTKETLKGYYDFVIKAKEEEAKQRLEEAIAC